MTHLFTSRNPLQNLRAHFIAFLCFAMLPLFSFSSVFTPLVDIVVSAGDSPEDISWELKDLDGNLIISGGAPFFHTMELPAAFYNLTMNDAVGDGWNGANFTILINQSQMPMFAPLTFPDGSDGGETTGPQSITVEFDFVHMMDINQSYCNEEPGDYFDGYDVIVNSYAYWFAVQWIYYQSFILGYGFEHCCGNWSESCQNAYNWANSYLTFGELLPDGIPEITPTAVFNDSRLFVNLADGEPINDLGCAVADLGQNQLWFKFTAGHTNSLISARREGSGNFNGVIEVYDAIGGNQIVCQDDYSTANEVAVFPTEIGQEYFFKVYHNGATVLNNGSISVGVAFVPQAELSSADCGRMNLTDTDIIRSNWPVNQFLLEMWKFEFKELEAPFNTYEVISPNGSNPQFRWFWFPQREPGRTYEVRTKALMYQGPTWADWGTPCIIGTAPAAPGQPAGLAQYPEGSSTSFSNEIGVQLWPNPAQHEVNISFRPAENDSRADISVFDVSGKEVDRVQHAFDRGTYQNIRYNNEKLNPGIYLFHIRTETASSVARLVVTD